MAKDKILTVHEPWAWAFFDLVAGKDIENRLRATKHRGPLAIHVSRKQLKPMELNDINASIVRAISVPFLPVEIPPRDKSLRGHIIGVVDVIDCIRDSLSRWAIPGYWHWVVANPRRVKPVPIVGQQGMFERELELEYL